MCRRPERPLCVLAALTHLIPALASSQTPVDEERFIEVGGIEQWITIRGDDTSNPVVMFLHGGPGSSLTPFAEKLLDGWEQHFTLVQWDQPGAGRTFGKTRETIADDLTIARVVDDGIAVTEHVSSHLEKEKIILLGGSWGSVIGVRMVHARPDLFHAYVGTSQIVDFADGLAEGYRLARERAEDASDSEILEQLNALGAPPWDSVGGLAAHFRIARQYEAENARASRPIMELVSDDYGQDDLEVRFAGDQFSQLHFFGRNLDGELMDVDLAETVDALDVPVLILQGAEDLVTPPAHAEAFLNSIDAPHKEFVLLPRVGHDTFTQAPDLLLEELRRRVLPLAGP